MDDTFLDTRPWLSPSTVISPSSCPRACTCCSPLESRAVISWQDGGELLRAEAAVLALVDHRGTLLVVGTVHAPHWHVADLGFGRRAVAEMLIERNIRRRLRVKPHPH